MEWIWPMKNMDLWEIKNEYKKICIKWSRNYYEDYKKMASQFFICGYHTFSEVIGSGHDNVKSDMWFLAGLFLTRQSIELGLKSLLCRSYQNNKDIQNALEDSRHDLSKLLKKYNEITEENYLTNEEQAWLIKYFISLEEVDKNSDIFRFPFEDEFLVKYRGKFLDNVEVANNIVQAYYLVKKCIQRGCITSEETFDKGLKPELFIFAKHGIGNCYLHQKVTDEGFHIRVRGYIEVINYIYNDDSILINDKFYPVMFMYRNTIELCLKRLLYSRVSEGVPLKICNSKRKSHLLKKDLWNNVKPVICRYSYSLNDDTDIIDITDGMINCISMLDKNGDLFRYPTSYSLEYRFDNKTLDFENVCEFQEAIINFLDGCDSHLNTIANYEAEMFSYHEWDY